MWQKMTSVQKKLIEIQENQAFDCLDSFKDAKIWSTMTKEERNLFALLLLRQAAQQLQQGEGKVLDNFALAAKVSEDEPQIFYQQGLIFVSYPENSRCLDLACEAFARAVEKNPQFLMAWYQWGNACVSLGVLNAELHYFTEANSKYEKASILFDVTLEQEIGREVLEWKRGICLALLGGHSGEPVDYMQAISHYRQAANLHCQESEFFNDYGHAVADLAFLVDRQELFIEAAQIFDEAIKRDAAWPGSWYNRASCMLRLCEINPQEEYFEQANQCLERAAELDPENYQIWLRWGQLESSLGKFKRDHKILESSLEKFSRANELEANHATILRCWAEAELFLGSHQERLELIQAAKQKIIKSIELHPEAPDAWYIYGASLNELGNYFEEEDFFYQALEKFHYGLSIAPQHPLLWYGLALAHFALGEMTEDSTLFEKSIQYCARVIECGGEAFPQFWNDWGVALLKLGEMTQQASYVEMAIEKFERALKRPAHSEYEDVDLEWVYNYGCAYDLLGDFSEDARHVTKAIQVLEQVVQLDAGYVHARYNLALSLAHLGELTCDIEPYFKAIDHFQALLETDPEDDLIHMDFGVSLINLALLVQDDHHPERAQNLFRQAEAQLMQAASLGNCQAYYQLAGLYSLTKHCTLAMHYMERAQFFGALPSLDELIHDDWLDGLRHTPAFKNLINQLSSQQSKEDK
jgi:tetratricopeptide (TPR) repeat protein